MKIWKNSATLISWLCIQIHLIYACILVKKNFGKKVKKFRQIANHFQAYSIKSFWAKLLSITTFLRCLKFIQLPAEEYILIEIKSTLTLKGVPYELDHW